MPAATIESGVQFIDLYPAAQKVGKLVIGGTCDTVGVAGCWLSGCYGVFSKKFGAGALNMLAARVVLANGTLVTASKCVNPDLFWSLRGGGGGNTGVVTEFVVRTHPAPKSVTGLSFSGSATTRQEYQLLFEAALKAYAGVTQDADQASNGGFGFGRSQTKPYSYSVSINLQGYESDLEKQRALLQPLADFVAAQPSGSNISGSIGGENTWTAADYDPTAVWGVGNGSLREYSNGLRAISTPDADRCCQQPGADRRDQGAPRHSLTCRASSFRCTTSSRRLAARSSPLR